MAHLQEITENILTQALVGSMQEDFNDWASGVPCKKADEFNSFLRKSQRIKQYFDNAAPQYFSGDFKSEFVLVSLYPKRLQEHWLSPCMFPNFKAYFDFYSSLGKNVYIEGIIHKSRFDNKQISFVRPFGVLQFMSDMEKNSRKTNLAKVIDEKLQLELIPYGTPDLDYNLLIGCGLVERYLENVIKTIFAYDRKVVVFTGSIFRKILKPTKVLKEFEDFLVEKNGNLTTVKHKFQICELQYEDKVQRVVIADHYSVPGVPLNSYAKRISDSLRQIRE